MGCATHLVYIYPVDLRNLIQLAIKLLSYWAFLVLSPESAKYPHRDPARHYLHGPSVAMLLPIEPCGLTYR